jgi:acetylornithine deacetylase/succinyl-diaminopimelate desuccinylase-like protein
MIREIQAITRTPAFTKYLTDLLVEICQVNTTPGPDIAAMRDAEARCFALIERELRGLALPGLTLERRKIDPAIARHPAYSQLHFTKTAQQPAGLPPETVYAERANLIATIPGTTAQPGGERVALNAHVDIVHPYFPPRVADGKVYGRGTCDDKGQVISIIAALKVVAQLLAQRGLKLNRTVTGMFVVEEETGGNGSLALALDRQLKQQYDCILVMECTDNVIHPANRGAVWYQCLLRAQPGLNLFELFAFVNEEMEKEGRSIKTESRHGLFPQRPVQTCHGIIGKYGEHPSRICGEVTFRIACPQAPGAAMETLVRDCLEFALETYIGMYGDKTKYPDPVTGKPKVDHHYDLRREGHDFLVDVHGSTGHMGAILENDGAITKMAHFVRALVYSQAALAKAAGGPVKLALEPMPAGDLMLEGGQGFVPTHPIEEVQTRFAAAAARGAETYLRRTGRSEAGTAVVKVTYDKLHNAAFDGDPDSPAMRAAMAAARAVGLPCASQTIRGWTVSCDSRLFATEYPGMPVLTFGSGTLAHAHSDQEQLDLEEMRKATETLILWLLTHTGTVSAE